MELIPCVDLILQMEPIPVVELIPVNDMIPTFMILIPTYPHCGIGDSNSNSKKYWNHNTSSADVGEGKSLRKLSVVWVYWDDYG